MSERGARADERRVSSRPLAPDFAAWRTRLLSGVREEEGHFLQTARTGLIWETSRAAA